jgi:uncharacterized protein (TIGR02145 family)
MKTFTLSIAFFLAVYVSFCQNYLITFAGTGAATTVDSVKVENLSQCTSLVLGGTDTLVLNPATGIIEPGNPHDFIKVYPNPSPGLFKVEIETTPVSNVCIGLYDLSGKIILHRKEFVLEDSHVFQLDGIQSGVCILKVETGNYLYTAKLISIGAATGNPMINDNGNFVTGKQSSSARTTGFTGNGSIKSMIIMPFNEGDTLKLTGKSGVCRTVTMLVPNQSQTVTFQFTRCSDADSNHYAVVQIGSQLWMQENLKTTKYRDGSDIPNVPDSATWANLSTGAYCDFLNLPEEGEQYGHLYNFYAVDDSRKICPAGWHVPSTTEWNILELYLDNTVDTNALGPTGLEIGRILKEGCDTRWQYWDTTYGLNSAGFTALCANGRTASGGWNLAPDHNHDTSFWTATSYNTSSAWFRSLRWCYSDIYSLFPMKKGGNSVRCVKDQ